MDLQNLELVKLLISKGADVNSLTYGGHSAYHLTHGRQNTNIQNMLHDITDHDLRDLPESESEDSEDEYEDDESDLQSDEEVCVCACVLQISMSTSSVVFLCVDVCSKVSFVA